MSKISDNIESIVEKARSEREKSAEAEEKGFSSDQDPGTISKGMGHRLKKASEQIRTNDPGVTHESVLNFMQELL